MLTTVALMAVLTLAPGQSGQLTLTHVRTTHGTLGPTRQDNKVLPGELFAVNEFISPRYFTCPGDTNRKEMTTWANASITNVSYTYVSPGLTNAKPDVIVVRCPVHGHVVLGDGRVLQGSLVAKLGVNTDNTVRLKE